MDTQIDLYGLLGVEPTASMPEIKRAYRKKALTCHPDKNPDNPRAAELFQELSRVLEILTDTKARADYDQAIAARKQAKERIRQFDAKRKKFKEDLEAREEAYRRSVISAAETEKSNEEQRKAEVKRLQEWYKQMEEEMIFTRKLFLEKLYSSMNTTTPNVREFRIRIRWKVQDGDQTNGGYNYDNLHTMFSKYGDIEALVVSSTKKGSAMIEFGDKGAAETALLAEIGLVKNPLTLRGLWDKQTRSDISATSTNSNIGRPTFPATTHLNSTPCASLSFPSAPDIFTQQTRVSDAEFENSVLANLRRAEERKRLIEELKEQEET
ncbi:PREDICTED: dnaJ homolog subfamily C member 17 [Vollenhovia emeryi]|uniref:dnaJ homolog subfamily C member 17 n=1 Tax=Vollenhovia emeryi TaxID=411798 RepID=UPI0005F3B224|nr:PREDICTED: dnaJ homolog subfamily C member 17 [Vollenhovia emeryi]